MIAWSLHLMMTLKLPQVEAGSQIQTGLVLNTYRITGCLSIPNKCKKNNVSIMLMVTGQKQQKSFKR